LERPQKIKILYVDDEINNLNGFKASFRIDYNVLISNDTVEALALLEKNPDIRVILCDQRMPTQTGVQFFEQIRSLHPLPIRILITGYTDIESVIDSINKGNIFRYVKKPWTDTDVKSAIEEANKFYVANSMLALKNDELEKAYTELDKFAYSVTHDMRGPLMSLLGAIDISRQTNDIGEIKETLGMMEKSVRKLDDFITSIHEYYSLKRGQLQITEVNFNAMVKDLFDIYGVAGRLEHVAFNINVIQNEMFRSDAVSLKIILNNLVSNAFKFQRHEINGKKVDLNITVEKNSAKLVINDNGIGINNEYINDIFKMFYRATSNEVGSGFGLYNVKDALSKLNGEIFVTSTPQEGTTFKVIIPSK
jgi:two-component system sensor histidine kinase/response regulator